MRGFISAMSFLTVIPFPERLKASRESGMFPWYPAAGLVIGCLSSLLFLGAALAFSRGLAAVVLVAGSLALTGAIHLDGLADCADAFYGRRGREETLRILKDPRIGTMGGAAIGISLLARFAAITSLPTTTVLLALPVLCSFSRTSALVAMRLLPYVRSSGGIIRAGTPVTPRVVALAACVIAAAAVFFPIPTAGALLLLTGFWRLSWKRIGGCTGDVLGASIEIAEIAFFCFLSAQVHLALSVGASYPLASIIFAGLAF